MLYVTTVWGTRWTDQDDVLLLKLVGEAKGGKVVDEWRNIAERMGRTSSGVRWRYERIQRRIHGEGTAVLPFERSCSRWTEKADAALIAAMMKRKESGAIRLKGISYALGRSVPAINSRWRTLRREGKVGAESAVAGERWTQDEDAILSQGYHSGGKSGKVDWKELADQLGRTVVALRKRRERLGLKCPKASKFSPEQSQQSADQKVVGIRETVVKQACNQAPPPEHDVPVSKPDHLSVTMNRRLFTADEDAFIILYRTNCTRVSWSWIAQKLGRPESTVRRRWKKVLSSPRAEGELSLDVNPWPQLKLL